MSPKRVQSEKNAGSSVIILFYFCIFFYFFVGRTSWGHEKMIVIKKHQQHIFQMINFCRPVKFVIIIKIQSTSKANYSNWMLNVILSDTDCWFSNKIFNSLPLFSLDSSSLLLVTFRSAPEIVFLCFSLPIMNFLLSFIRSFTLGTITAVL